MQVEYLPEKENRKAGFVLVAEKTRVKFNPGLNDVADNDWKNVKDHDKIKQRIESGALKVHSASATKTKPEPKETTATPEK